MPDADLPSLVDAAQIKEAEIKAKQAFIDLSLEELERGFKDEQAAHMKTLIGDDEYQWLHSAFVEYNKLRVMAVEAGTWYINHPSKAINRQRNKLFKLINSKAKAAKKDDQ